jgi:hypothetical protein
MADNIMTDDILRAPEPDLDQIGDAIQSGIADAIQSETAGLRSEVAGLRNEVAGLKLSLAAK